MRTGVYGGSFNPPHLAHLVIAETMREQFQLDRILWIPGYIPPHKQHLQLASPEHRLAMTRLATVSNPSFDVSTIELERKGTSFTIETLKALQNEHPEEHLFLIVGGDSLRDFMTWRAPEELITLAPLLVFKRPESNDGTTEAERLFPDRIFFAEAPLLPISSSDIRQRRLKRESIRYLVPGAVERYIEKHGLYRGAGVPE